MHPAQTLLRNEHITLFAQNGPVSRGKGAYRFLERVPEQLQLPLLRLVHRWHEGGNHDTASELVADLAARLRSAMTGGLEDESRRDDLTGLLAALGAHRGDAVAMAAAVRRGARR